jgi:hypothetical protein
MLVPPPPAAAPVQPPPRRAGRGPIVVLVVLAILVAAGGGMLLARELSAPASVSLEPVDTAGADPFMASVGTDVLDVRPVAHTGGRRAGTTPGIYGGSGSDSVCDRGQLSRFLGAHPDRAAGWASVLGLPDASSSTVSRYVDGLTAVVLRSDTYVTNHGWSGGHVTSRPAVLQAGTAVLVDHHGNPVTRCFCGNPLSAPQSFGSVVYLGPRWISFTSNQVTVITHQTTTVTNDYTIVDVHTGRGHDRPAGTSGESDRPADTVRPDFPPATDTGTSGDDPSDGSDDATPPETGPGGVTDGTGERTGGATGRATDGVTERPGTPAIPDGPALVGAGPTSPSAPETPDDTPGPAAPGTGTTGGGSAVAEPTAEASTPSSSTPTDVSGTWTADGCSFGDGTVSLGSAGDVLVGGSTVGSYGVTGSALRITAGSTTTTFALPTDGSTPSPLVSSGSSACTLSRS